MAEDGLEGSGGWTNKSCEELLVLQPTPDCRYHLEDSAQENALDQVGALQLTNCLEVELSSQVKDLSLESAVQGLYEGAPERECGEPADSTLLSQGLCSPLADTITLELPNASYSKTEGSPTRIIDSMCVPTRKEDGNRSQLKWGSLSCPICQNSFYSLSELKEHFKSHTHTGADFTCWEGGCFFTTQDRKNFLAHLQQAHRVSPVPCSQRTCKLLFSSQEEMSLHFRNHFPFHCHSCDFVSSNVKLFTQHSKKHPPGEETRSGGDALESAEASVETVAQDALHTNEAVTCDLVPTNRPGKRMNSVDLYRNCETPANCDDEDGESAPRKKKAGKLKTVHNAKTKASKGDVEKGNEHLFKTHMCPECKRCFKKRTHLAEHLHLHFPDPNLQCPNCHKFFTSRSKLKIHMMRESGEKTHRCPLCDYCSVESNALNRHMASIHEEVSNFYSDTYSCPVCQETFKLSQALKDHMKGHKSEQKMLLCFQEGCGQALSDRKEFLRHLKEAHGIRGVECTYHACSLLFKSREEMEQHRRKHYAFHCQECDFACSNKHAFRKHKKNGHPGKEELSCRFCSYRSFNPVEYADHVGKMHASEKIHRCGDCSFATAHKRVLIRHMLLHTGEKPHKCNLCDFTCRDISYLSKHMLTHSSEKNYMCTECGYITKWKHYLNVHMRKHSGDLRYQCNQCSYRCHRADQLSSHKLRHQGKNLICEICGFGCKRKYELQKHMQIKHSLSCQLPVYQCQHCSYQTKYKQALLNHENCKHTKHREFRCALCPYRTFSNTSLFFHKRKSHGYIPGDKDWLEKYASKQQEIDQAGVLFPYNTEASGVPDADTTSPVVHQKCKTGQFGAQGPVDRQVPECLQVGEIGEPSGDANMADEALMATVTLEPVETCDIVINDFPVQLGLPASAELLSKTSAEEALVTCETSLPAREEILCFSETLTVGGSQEFEEETGLHSAGQDKHERVVCPTAVQYDQETILCDLNGKCEELPVHVATLDLQPGDIPVEVQESWADAVKDGVELTIVCESEGLIQNDAPELENSAASPDEAQECSRPESILEVLRKQDKEQAETLVLEGRVQMLVVQSSTQVYKCETCSYITKKEGSMLQHSKIGCHARKPSLVCKDCGANFKQQRGLNTHIQKKCPVTLRKKKSARAPPASDEPDPCPLPSITPALGSSQTDGHAHAVSPEGTVQGSQWSERCLEEVNPLTPSLTLVSKEFQETTPKKLIVLDKDEAVALTSPDPQAEHSDNTLCPSGFQENGRYRYDDGRFRCLLCSFSCSRECTISCHIKENCRGIKRTVRVRCPTAPITEGALRKNPQEKHQEQNLCQEKDQGPERSAHDGGQKTEDDVGREKDVDDGIVEPDMEGQHGTRLSCPICPFMCSQERAMKTHMKKGCLKQGELQCPLCSFRCMSSAALKRHRDLHQKYTRNRAQLQCKQCDFTCKQPRCMKQHVRIRHEGIKPHRCRYCDFSTTRRYRLDAHESLHTGVGRISCGSCNRTFGTNSKLRLHQRRAHEKKPTHFCSLCDYSGYSQNDIARHVGSCHSGELAFPCSVCQVSFSSEAALKQHSLRKHQEKATHLCPRCPFTCHSVATLRCHLQKQHLQLECSVCKQSFPRRLDLDEHRKSHFTHRCQQCQYAAKDRQQLVHHYSEEHEKPAPPDTEEGEGPLKCPFCPFSCHHQLVYDHHVKGHGGTRLYKCTDCEYTTRNKQKITWHSRIHTGEKPYKCHLCTYACADPSRLKYHMRIHKDEKKYLCPECGYKCKWVNQLKYHMTKHTGLKPYRCEECDYCTNRADALRVHRETRHRDVRSFMCEQCGKAFKTRFLLKTHLKKHSEEKPYVCNICQSSFRWPAGLRHHYLTHTNQQPFFCQYCSYRAKQKFQVVKHLQRHHPDCPDISKGVGKERYLSTIDPQALGNPKLQQATEHGGQASSGDNPQA